MPPPMTITSCMVAPLADQSRWRLPHAHLQIALIRRAGGAFDISELGFGQKIAQRAAQLRVMPGLSQSDEARQQRAHTCGRVTRKWADEDFRVPRFRQTLFIDFKFFEELFTGPYAGKDDLDVFTGTQAGKRDEVFGEIEDAHRLAHVEHEDFAAAAHRPGLQDELAGFGDRHEVAHHLRVRHRHRAAPANLLAKDWDHRPRRADDVAEAHRY